MGRPYYESDRAASEYLFLHYGNAEPASFPARCVDECLDARRLPVEARALDLGCAVGGASFVLARYCSEVVGIDYSRRFIAIAGELQKKGAMRYETVEEGELTLSRRAVVPREIKRRRVRFARGDAMKLPGGLGRFEVVLMANLIDRLGDPRKCLEQLPALVTPGGRLIITSPYTWLAEYTPRRHWLGGFLRDGRPVRTFDTLAEILSPNFQLVRRSELPFQIREHARKFQLGVAEASVWTRL